MSLKQKNSSISSATVLLLYVFVAFVYPQSIRRCRGEGFFLSESANTPAVGSVWSTVKMIGFVWDNPRNQNKAKPFPFIESRLDAGLMNFLGLSMESRLISYIWDSVPQFGFIAAAMKLTLPNNKELRFHGLGLSLKYSYDFVKNFPSLAGFRFGGTGFSPEGFRYAGGCYAVKLLYELDFISKISFLPLKVIANAGVRIPQNEEFQKYSQLILNTGIGFSSLWFDLFTEYSFEGFVNNSFKPKQFIENWWTPPKHWEVALSENPIYITAGGRLRQQSGLILYFAVPWLISKNQGTAMIDEDRINLHRSHKSPYVEERNRGITDPFDPWYAKWKVVMELTIPIRYQGSSAEMIRTFLLLKGRSKQKKIDIEETLKGFDDKEKDKQK